MADQETPSDPPVLPPAQAPVQVGGFKSFDASSFFQTQQQLKEEQNVKFLAAAEAILSSSSDSEGDSSASEPPTAKGEGSKNKKKRHRDGKDVAKVSRKQKKRKKDKEKRAKDRSQDQHQKQDLERSRIIKKELKHGADYRAVSVRGWLSGNQLPAGDAFYADKRPDLGNIAYNGLALKDIATYKRHDPSQFVASIKGGRGHDNAGSFSVSNKRQQQQRPQQQQQQRGAFLYETDGNSIRTSAGGRGRGRGRGGGIIQRYYQAHARRKAQGNGKVWRRYEEDFRADAGAALAGSAGASRLLSTNTTNSMPSAVLPGSSQESWSINNENTPGYLPLDPLKHFEDTKQSSPVFRPTTTAEDLQRQAATERALQQHAAAMQGETPEQYLLRRTRGFNEATREQPTNEEVWLEYAAFQDDSVKLIGRVRGAKQGAMEKKVAILNKALTYCPTSVKLQLAWLQTVSADLEAPEMDNVWKKVLANNPGSPQIWKLYLQQYKSQNVHVTDITARYTAALTALNRHLTKLKEQEQATKQGPSSVSFSPSLEQLESEIVGLLLESIAFQLQTGYTETAIAQLQVVLEYNFFPPEGWTEDVLEMMFEDYWGSGAPLIGSPGSSGWAAWLAGDPSSGFLLDADALAALEVKRKQAALERKREQQRQQQQEEEQNQQVGEMNVDKEEEEEGFGGWKEVREPVQSLVLSPEAAAAAAWKELGTAVRAHYGHTLDLEAAINPNVKLTASDKSKREDHTSEADKVGALETTSTGAAAKERMKGKESDSNEDEGGNKNESSSGDDRSDSESHEEEEEEEDLSEERLQALLEAELEAAMREAEQLPPDALSTWLSLESTAQAQQWHPSRPHSTPTVKEVVLNRGDEHEHEDDYEEKEDRDEVVAATVQWRDIQHCLIQCSSTPTARSQLLHGCLALLGTPFLSSESCIGCNSPAAAAVVDENDELYVVRKQLGLISAKDSNDGDEDNDIIYKGVAKLDGDWSWLNVATSSKGEEKERKKVSNGCDFGQHPWYRELLPERRNFVLRLLCSLLEGSQKYSPSIASAALRLASEHETVLTDDTQEETSLQQKVSYTRDWAQSKSLAQQLLAQQRDNLVLWAAYAELEKKAGSIKAARKVYHTCFSSASQPLLTKPGLPGMVLDAVKLELQVPLEECDQPPVPPACIAAAPLASASTALQLLAWLSSNGAVALPPLKAKSTKSKNQTTNLTSLQGEEGVLSITSSDVVAARRGYQDALLKLLPGGQASITADGAALVTAAAAFEQLAGAVIGNLTHSNNSHTSLGTGLKSALAIYDQVLTSLLDSPVKKARHGGDGGATTDIQKAPSKTTASANNPYLQQLCVDRSNLLTSASYTSATLVAPAAARASLHAALTWFPACSSLLRGLLNLELSSHALTSLRQKLHLICSETPSTAAWLAAVALEVAAGSPARSVRSVFQRAIRNDAVSHNCPVVWRSYLRFEAALGKWSTVRQLFLQAVSACKWSKALWLDGLVLLNGRVSPRELAGYMELMRSRGLKLRTEVYQVAIAQMEAATMVDK